jgi:rod shape determining protein RodA
MKKNILGLFDISLFFSVLVLVTIGIVFIYSSGINSSGMNVSNEFVKQIIFAITGLILMVFAALIDYRRIYRYVPYFFIGLCMLLLYTGFFGRYVNGAKSWIGIGEFGVQPSEFGKIIFILFFSWYLDKSSKYSERRRFIAALCILLIPLLLILLQPDLGTASVYIPIFLIMSFIAGIPLRYLLLVILSGSFTIIFTVLPIWESEIARKSLPIMQILRNDTIRFIIIISTSIITLIGIIGRQLFKNRYYYWISFFFGILTFSLAASLGVRKVLKEYQIKRLIVFLNPDTDPLGA